MFYTFYAILTIFLLSITRRLTFFYFYSFFLVTFPASSLASHHEHDVLTLSPSHHTVVRYTNESLIVQCRSAIPDVKLHWKSPKGEIIKENKGRIHIEQNPPSGK